MATASLLVVELTTAGGLGTGNNRATSISIEGLAMARALVIDGLAGEFEVHVMMQEAILPPGDEGPMRDVHWHQTKPGDDIHSMLRDIAPRMDYCILVAPEFDNLLVEYTRLLESCPCTLLGQPSRAVLASSGKMAAMIALAAAGVQVPLTRHVEAFLGDPSYPAVVKPDHGAGCIGVFLARDKLELDAAVAANDQAGIPHGEIIVQQFIKGQAMSASFVATRHGTTFLGINEQDIILEPANGSASKYRGGIVGPLHPELQSPCEHVASIMTRLFQLDGYFGFDFILDPLGSPVVVEINPRFTTSFAGLNMLHGGSVLKYMVQNKVKRSRTIPFSEPRDFAAYNVLSLPGNVIRQPRLDKLQSASQVVIIPRTINTDSSVFVVSRGSTRSGAVASLASLVTLLKVQ